MHAVYCTKENGAVVQWVIIPKIVYNCVLTLFFMYAEHGDDWRQLMCSKRLGTQRGRNKNENRWRRARDGIQCEKERRQ